MGSSASKTASSTTMSSPSPAIHRAFSFPTPLVHHPPARKGDTHHLVSLTSTSYGSLLLIDLEGSKTASDRISISGPDPVSLDSFSPDSVINTWELMDGLDDDEFEFECPKLGKPISNSDLCPKPDPDPNVSALKLDESYEVVRVEQEVEEGWVPLSYKPKQPLWKHLSEESFLSGLDPSIVSSYKKPLSSKQLSNDSINVEVISPPSSALSTTQAKAEDKIVLYFTTLRGIRKTYENCCCVRTILRGFQVTVDERDISMDSKYRKELQSMVGDAEKPVCLPQVFIGDTHIGGVEEIMKLNDSGELVEMLKGFPACECLGTCKSCGDARFVPCSNCDGSTKVFEEEDEMFKRCSKCNENGLVRCLECCL
ncbi:BnaC04g24540D [Brassica napus]|uniref:BnaC04g24540D protein n=1 Tax=Brassica napus TaxID=3708 RepID=A0A078GWW0_BRANA|nr:BnaC04g24540D [Brassica napus]